MSHLLLLEEDAEIRLGLTQHLNEEGFQVHAFSTGKEALRFLAQTSVNSRRRIDAAVLDLTLPRTDGLEILRVIRVDTRTRHLPVLLVTGRNGEIDLVLAENLWADDYASKPISSRELLARLRAILRRASFLDKEHKPSFFSFGPLSIDLERHVAKVGETALDLTRREFELLAYFVQNPCRVHSREKILHLVWGLEHLGESRTIDAHVRRVRAKLGEASGLIETVVGAGYRMGGAEALPLPPSD
ncbi:MAG: response regulator transcription factor [Holophaga sp.]|nr:response regulator transcription factor [Holophaga sp.]